VIRELARTGLSVIAIGKGYSGGYLSKYPLKKFNLQDFDDNEYIDFIIDTAIVERADAIFAHFEDTLLNLHLKVFGRGVTDIKIIMPPYDMLKLAIQKDKMLSISKQCGLCVPKSEYFSIDCAKPVSVMFEAFNGQFPLFVKTLREIGTPPGPGNRYIIVKSSEDLSKLEEFVQQHQSVVVQELIEGQGCGIAGVFHEGNPVGVGGHLRLRESFSTGGMSTYCISKIYKPAMDDAILLMKALKWTGIAMIEFKIRKKDGKAYFMEVNPRLWGTLPLYIRSGINVPRLAYDLFVKNIIHNSCQMKEGIKLRFFTQDLKAIRNQCNGVKMTYELTKAILTTPWYTRDELFSWKDPKPFLISNGWAIFKKLKGC
jgi:predicted ATP-grasp superfamily ATP-dependent carboligase